MPTTHLWAVSSCGKVYLLPSNGQQWEELRYYGVDFKRVSAVERCAWAIGGDHQVYVYVTASEVPIGFKEIAYENQRWNPKNGFCNQLLPTDRPGWSSQDGLVARQREKVKLPTMSWKWQGDWAIEDNLDGQPLGSEGWMYAIDFPMTYGPDKRFSSLVRRRKWVRYRSYIAMDRWTWVPSIHADPVKEPFIDVSVGGLDMPGGDGDTLAVWAVTVQSRVMFRYNVMYNNPEGDGWMHITTPSGMEINQVSVGPTGLVWAVVWDGRALVRAGVTRFKITGTSWLEVDFPHDDSRLLNVSVGTNVVWAVSRDGKVWFRKGIRGMDAGTCDQSAKGVGWVEMVGSMSLVTVGPNDQVWAVGKEDQNIVHFRTDVTTKDLSGKRWKAIMLPMCRRVSPTSSEASLSLHLTQSATLSIKDYIKDESDAVPNEHVGCEGDSGVSEVDSSAPSHDEVFPSEYERKSGPAGDTTNDVMPEGGLATQDSQEAPHKALPNYLTPGESSPRLSRSSISSSQGSVSGIEDELFQTNESDFIWCWVNGGGCCIDSGHPLNWFSSGVSNICSHRKELWRKELVHKLGGRHEKEVQRFIKYEYAIEKKSWTKSGKCQVWDETKQWVECQLELEQMATDNTLDSGTLTCMYKQNGLKKVHASLIDVTCVLPCASQSKQVVDIYTAERTVSNMPIRLTFSSDTDMEDWIAVISTTCNDVRSTRGKPLPNAIWATSTRGDVFAHNPEDDLDFVPPNHAFWRQIGGHLRVVETCQAGVVWGLGYNSVVWVYTGGWGGGLFQGLASSPTGIHSMTDVRHMYIYENQRWNPLTGFSSHGLPTDRYMWSDRSGRHECTKENARLPSLHWQWNTDWAIDYNTPSGVDKDGWQYAKDFPRTYHAHKGIVDYVRRRRWQRKCKLITSGPWQELESVRLQDISFQVDYDDTFNKLINLWAVDNLGNVLYRHGVSQSCPQGTSWEHVPTDQKFVAISVGGKGRVWGVSRNGSAFLRNGVNSERLTGMHWFHVEPPNKDSPLQLVSAGASAVWAVDKNCGLWVRQEVMPMFPEGTCWKYVCPNVRKVSVGPKDQVWVILDSADTPSGAASGLICRRLGVTNEEKLSRSWEFATGGGWCHVSARSYVSREST